MRLKRHESPRRRGRNSKGKLAPAKLRQVKKKTKNDIKRLSK